MGLSPRKSDIIIEDDGGVVTICSGSFFQETDR